MSSLHLLVTKVETGIPFSSLLLLVQQHVQEGHFTFPKPEAELTGTTAAPPTKASSSSVPPANSSCEGAALQLPPPPPAAVSKGNAAPSSTTSTIVQPLRANDIATEAVATTATASSTLAAGTRSVGGFVAPPSPYTAFRKPHMRRPNSATQRSASQHCRDPQPPSSLLPSEGTPPPPREARRLEYVDRWLEKLYFRNPVIVSTTSRPASPLVKEFAKKESGYHHAANPTVQQPTLSSSQHPSPPYEEGEATIVAMLPPKPVARNANVWREVLEEKLVSCFEAGTPQQQQPHHATEGRPPLRASSARPGSANRRAQPPSVGTQQPAKDLVEEQEGRVDASLPNVSKFVARKRMIAA